MRIRKEWSACALAAGLSSVAAAGGGPDFQLTILHNNDGESQLINLGGDLSDFGGIARFATLVNNLRQDAANTGRSSILLSSGDNFLAGPEFNASIDNGVPYYDAVALDLIGYDAFCIGNHEFDFGPSILANFINSFASDTAPWLSANLDVAPEDDLAQLGVDGRIAASTVVERDGQQIGIIGATTPNLSFISSPGDVVVGSDVAAAVQAEVTALQNQGINKIILIAHLQGINEDLELIAQLSGIDVVIAGGGDELLADAGTVLIPDDAIDEDLDGQPDEVFGDYPLTATDLDGQIVPVVTTKGSYRYVGRLNIDFDASGNVIAFEDGSGPVRVAGGSEPDAVTPDPTIQTTVVDPVEQAVKELANTIVGTSEVELDGRRTTIRARESNEGNLIADAIRWQAEQLADEFNVPVADVAFQNGGGIRNDSILPAGDISELDTFDMLPFANFVSVFPAVDAAEILTVLENAVSRIDPPDGFPTSGTGRFAQVSGLSFTYLVTNDPGARIQDITLDNGTKLVENGVVVEGAPTIAVATIDFLARGGDEYPFTGDFTILGASYQQALENYIETGLNGQIAAADYPVGGEGRIFKINPDINDDDLIGVDDLLILLADWGPCADVNDCAADLTGDGNVDVDDLLVLLSYWGS